MGLDLNVENLDEISDYLKLIDENLSALSSNMNNINIESSLLSSASLFNATKGAISKIINGSYNDISLSQLEKRINNTRTILENANNEIGNLFDKYDKFSFEDFGNYSEFVETVGIKQEDVVINGQKVTVTTKYKTLPDGTKYQVNIIGEINENTPVILVNHGGACAGDSLGNGGDYRYLEEWLNSGELSGLNSVIVRYSRSTNGGADSGAKIVKDVVSTYNLSLSNCITAGFSMGGEPAIAQMADLLREDPTLNAPVIMLLDGNLQTKPSNVFTEEDLKLLGERNAVIYVVERANIRPDIADHQRWASEYGINVISIRNQHSLYGGMDGHECVFKDYFELGLFDFQIGQGVFPDGSFEFYGTEYDYFLPATRYNSETGMWENFDISGKNKYEVYEMLGIDYEEVGTFSIPSTETKPPVQETKPPVQETKPPVQETKPPVQETKPPVQETKPPVQETKPPVQETKPPVQETVPPVQETKPLVQETKPPVQETKPPVQETVPPVQETVPPVQETKPPVQETKPPVQETKPPVQETVPPVQETKPPVQETVPLVQETKPPVQETKPPVQETVPPVQETVPPVQETKPPVQETVPLVQETKNDYVSLKDGDSKKYIIPGIIGTGLALLSSKISKFIKKSRDNNDV